MRAVSGGGGVQFVISGWKQSFFNKLLVNLILFIKCLGLGTYVQCTVYEYGRLFYQVPGINVCESLWKRTYSTVFVYSTLSFLRLQFSSLSVYYFLFYTPLSSPPHPPPLSSLLSDHGEILDISAWCVNTHQADVRCALFKKKLCVQYLFSKETWRRHRHTGTACVAKF